MVYKWYFSCQLGDFLLLPTDPTFYGNQFNNHWVTISISNTCLEQLTYSIQVDNLLGDPGGKLGGKNGGNPTIHYMTPTQAMHHCKGNHPKNYHTFVSSAILPKWGDFFWSLFKGMVWEVCVFWGCPESQREKTCSQTQNPIVHHGQKWHKMEDSPKISLPVSWSKSPYIGDGRPPTFNRNPYNGYINPYYWVDDHPLLIWK